MCAFSPATIPAGTFNGGAITTALTIDPATDDGKALEIELPPAASGNAIVVRDSGSNTVLSVAVPGGGGLQYIPDHANAATFQFKNDGGLSFKKSSGAEYLAYTNSSGVLDLDPDNGQVYVKNGSLVLANSEPADATLAFNGCFAVYVDGNDLKAKAKIGGVYLHAVLGTFA